MLSLYRNYIPLGHPNRRGYKLTSINAIVFHYTANEERDMGDVQTEEYFSRPFIGSANGQKVFEANGKDSFAYGSAQVIADEDSVSETMPLDEVAWHVGDSRIPDGMGGFMQQPAAHIWLRDNPNYRAIGIEICNNANWGLACENAAQWAINYIQTMKFTINLIASFDPNHGDGVMKQSDVLLLRHYDISGKTCPKPFVDDIEAWHAYATNISDRVTAGGSIQINYL
jgi:N-acetylmuramoyl-L-alanine amidase